MTGTVRCFVPAARRGILQADNGQTLAFLVAPEVGDLQGGDLVEFEVGTNGQAGAQHVKLRHRWSDILNERHRVLVNQLHNTLEIQG